MYVANRLRLQFVHLHIVYLMMALFDSLCEHWKIRTRNTHQLYTQFIKECVQSTSKYNVQFALRWERTRSKINTFDTHVHVQQLHLYELKYLQQILPIEFHLICFIIFIFLLFCCFFRSLSLVSCIPVCINSNHLVSRFKRYTIYLQLESCLFKTLKLFFIHIWWWIEIIKCCLYMWTDWHSSQHCLLTCIIISG